MQDANDEHQADLSELFFPREVRSIEVSHPWGALLRWCYAGPRYASDSLKSLLQEIQSGASALERDDISGKAHWDTKNGG